MEEKKHVVKEIKKPDPKKTPRLFYGHYKKVKRQNYFVFSYEFPENNIVQSFEAYCMANFMSLLYEFEGQYRLFHDDKPFMIKLLKYLNPKNMIIEKNFMLRKYAQFKQSRKDELIKKFLKGSETLKKYGIDTKKPITPIFRCYGAFKTKKEAQEYVEKNYKDYSFDISIEKLGRWKALIDRRYDTKKIKYLSENKLTEDIISGVHKHQKEAEEELQKRINKAKNAEEKQELMDKEDQQYLFQREADLILIDELKKIFKSIINMDKKKIFADTLIKFAKTIEEEGIDEVINEEKEKKEIQEAKFKEFEKFILTKKTIDDTDSEEEEKEEEKKD